MIFQLHLQGTARRVPMCEHTLIYCVGLISSACHNRQSAFAGHEWTRHARKGRTSVVGTPVLICLTVPHIDKALNLLYTVMT